MTTIERRIFDRLIHRRRATYDNLISEVWNLDEPKDALGTLKIHMMHLRRKLAPLGIHFVTVRGQGIEVLPTFDLNETRFIDRCLQHRTEIEKVLNYLKRQAA